MRAAMAQADVGDDVYLEDPTVNRLQERAAEVFEREAALFVPSGTMGNQICVKLHTQPGQEIIIEQDGHIYNYEMGAMAVTAGALPRPIRGENGIIDWPTIEAAIRPPVYYCAKTGLICLENTHNMAGGAVMSKERMYDICEKAHARGLPVHLDGARIFNAATALGQPVADLTKPFDSVMFCLSKGLGAPVGSLIVGTGDFIERARVFRKLLGGGMRQVGVLAAAGLIALEKMPWRLHEDHATARLLAEGLAGVRGVSIDPETVQTNIIIFDISATGMKTAEFTQRLKEHGILANGINPRQMRMVTHYDVSREDCLSALKTISDIVRQ
jgi:threonine aldolase